MAIATGVVAVAGGRVALMLWATAVATMAGATLWWARTAWRGVSIEASFRPGRAFLGEPVTLRMHLVNTKRMPLPVVRLGIWLPPGLMPGGEDEGTPIRGFHRRLFVPGHSEAVLELPVRVLRRGEFWLERVEVELADPFELAPLDRELEPVADLIVLPDARIQIPVSVVRRLPFGHPAAAARMFEERERFAGVRAYEPGDPLNRIHWKLTGHTGLLQTKLFEPTRTADVMLALDLSVGEPFWDAIFPDVAEDTIGWASFLARQAMDGGWRVGL
ncbi:MAG TPA: DUF58 domain-containing protein, partial [Actinomycetota bacterium]